MSTLIAIPLLGILTILQSSIVSRVPLLHGTADLVLLALVAWSLQKRVQTAWQWSIIGSLLISLVTNLHIAAVLICYGLVTGLALLLRRRMWQAPLLAMFVTVFLGTLLTHGVSFAALLLAGSQIPLWEAMNLVTLPSMLLNFLLAVPAFAAIGDLASWVYPEEIEV